MDTQEQAVRVDRDVRDQSVLAAFRRQQGVEWCPRCRSEYDLKVLGTRGAMAFVEVGCRCGHQIATIAWPAPVPSVCPRTGGPISASDVADVHRLLGRVTTVAELLAAL